MTYHILSMSNNSVIYYNEAIWAERETQLQLILLLLCLNPKLVGFSIRSAAPVNANLLCDSNFHLSR